MEKTRVDTLTASQCKMARAGLGLSVTEASKVSLVSRASITRFESGGDIKPVLRSALRVAFERLGAFFTENGDHVRQGGGNSGVAEAAMDHAATVEIWVGTTSNCDGISSAIASVCM